MIKKTCDLAPGDRIYFRRRLVTIEMIEPGSDYSSAYRIQHSIGSGFFSRNAQWLVEEPLDDVVMQAEEHMAAANPPVVIDIAEAGGEG